MSTPNLITRKTISAQINQAAQIESEKSFYRNGGASTEAERRIDRRAEVRNHIRERLLSFDAALKGTDVLIYAVQRRFVLARVGEGIEKITALPKGSTDPDYPNIEDGKSHGGILASPRISVHVRTVGTPMEGFMLPDAPGMIETHERPGSLEIPLYTAVNFVSDPEMINPNDLPSAHDNQLRAYGTLLTIGDATFTHHDAITEALTNIS